MLNYVWLHCLEEKQSSRKTEDKMDRTIELNHILLKLLLSIFSKRRKHEHFAHKRST